MLDFTKGGVFRNITRKQFVTYTQNNIFSVARFTFKDPICVLYYGIYHFIHPTVRVVNNQLAKKKPKNLTCVNFSAFSKQTKKSTFIGSDLAEAHDDVQSSENKPLNKIF